MSNRDSLDILTLNVFALKGTRGYFRIGALRKRACFDSRSHNLN